MIDLERHRLVFPVEGVLVRADTYGGMLGSRMIVEDGLHLPIWVGGDGTMPPKPSLRLSLAKYAERACEAVKECAGPDGTDLPVAEEASKRSVPNFVPE